MLLTDIEFVDGIAYGDHCIPVEYVRRVPYIELSVSKLLDIMCSQLTVYAVGGKENDGKRLGM